MTFGGYMRLILFAALLLFSHNARAQDFKNAGDHPLVKRITGAEIFFQSHQDFDQLKLALEKIQWSGAEAKVKDFKNVVVEGKRFTSYYKLPEKITVLEAYRNYEQDFKEAGFEILFSALGEDLETVGYNNQVAREVYGMKGTYGTPEEKAQWPFQHTEEAKAGYLVARKTTENGQKYVAVYLVPNTHNNWLSIPVGRTLARVDVCEVKSREQRMEHVTSSQMASEISLNGRIALYGIQFNFNSATIMPESEQTLSEVAKLLSERGQLNILVVGHTDAIGSFLYNKNLSQERADAVVSNLKQKGIDAQRLFPVGVSFAAPIASNASEDGRAKNRRVELVDMAGGSVR